MTWRSATHIGIFARGFAIGTADLVPGVSGGTVAFITGIYDRLLTAIKVGSSPVSWYLVLRGQFGVFWRAADGTFLAVLLLGVIAAVFTVANLMHHLLTERTTVMLSFFAGLTLSAAVWIAMQIRPFRPLPGIAFALGLVLAVAVSLSPAAELRQAPPLQGFFVAGMVAICAMILPGISGSLILLLIGVYPFLIESVQAREWLVLATFAAGCALGLALFVRVLRWVLVNHRNETIAALVGVMLGALPKLWPWKEPADGVRIVLQPSIWPAEAANPEYLGAAFALIGGACLVFVCEAAARKMAKS